MDQIGEWCSEHGIAMTGHVLGEEHLSSQAGTVGDCMHCYRPMALPGVDILCDFREYTTVKQASSVARQNGKEGTVSELYGVTQWDCDFKTYKLQGDWQAALGITVRIPHLSHMSLKGEAKRDWPASIFYQSPWYQEFPYIEDYFARINTALTRGNAVVKVGVLHPVESMWLKLGPNEQTADICEQMEQDFQNLTEWLLYGTIDFDFLSEALLPMQCQTGANDRNSLLKVGCMSYSAVVIPEIATIRSSTLDILESFVDRGGRLIIMGRIPSLVDAKRSDRVKALAGRCVRITKGRSELYAAISEERVLDIRKEDGSRSDNLFYQMRQDGENNWLFICHVNRNDSHVSAAEKYVVKIRGSFDLTFYDAMTGEIRPFPSRQKKNFTIFDWETYHEDSILLRLEKKPEQPEVWGEHQRKHELTAVFTLEAPDSYRCLEPNVLLLDYARFRIDGGEVEKREEILRLDNRIRERLGFVLRGGEMNQPWFLQEKETHKVTLYYEIHSLIESPVNLAMEDVESCKAFLNGEPVCMKAEGYYVDPAIQVIKLPAIRPGKNQLALEVVYNQKSGLENIYLLGDFDVELNGTEAILKGRRKRLLPGDITRQGMPFYTGNLEYTYTFHVPDGESNCELHIPHIHAPALAVFLDGRKKGLIAYAPHCLALGKLSQGEHKLTILLYGNRFNAFGTLHNADKNFVWYGPDSYRTHGDAWTDCYMVRPVGMDAPEIMLVH